MKHKTEGKTQQLYPTRQEFVELLFTPRPPGGLPTSFPMFVPSLFLSIPVIFIPLGMLAGHTLLVRDMSIILAGVATLGLVIALFTWLNEVDRRKLLADHEDD